MRLKWMTYGLIVIMLLIIPVFANDHILMTLIVALHFSYLSQCWNLMGGYTGQLSMGHSIFYGVGAYVSTLLLLKLGVTPWIGLFIGGAAAALIAFLIGAMVFRYKIRGIYFALVTIAFSEIVRGVANNLEFINSSIGMLLPLKNDPAHFLFFERLPYYYIALALMLLMAGLTYLIEKSSLGYFLLAIREDEEAAMASGVNTNKYKTLIFAISAFFTAIGGTFYAQLLLFISPDIMFTLQPTVNMLLGTLVGGPGTVLGPILGSTIFTFVGEILRSVSFGQGTQAVTVTSAIYGITLMVVALYLPKGLIDFKNKIFRKRGGMASKTPYSQEGGVK